MIDSLTAPAGLETALGAALGEELTSALDPEADRHWRVLPPFADVAPLPAGATALAEMIEAPLALTRSLSQIGLVEDDAAAWECHADMSPGQLLVSRAGAVWRWDGYTIRAGAPTPAAVRLRQRNRLNDLREALSQAPTGSRADQRGTERGRTAGATAAALEEQSARNARRDLEAPLRARARGVGVLAHSGGHRRGPPRRRRTSNSRGWSRSARRQPRSSTTPGRRTRRRPDIEGLREAVEQARAALTAARTREVGRADGAQRAGPGTGDLRRSPARDRVRTHTLDGTLSRRGGAGRRPDPEAWTSPERK